jgi:Family of unknown function (DUF5675)
MQLTVQRTTFTSRSTIGQFFINGAFECFTLEDMVRPVKVPGMTAIPEGVYVVTVSFSDRFKRLLPEVHNVPNFTGVRIHPGNTDADTEGCILVGQTKAVDFIGNSRGAFNKLFATIQAAAQREKIFLEVTSTAAATVDLGAAPRRHVVITADTPARRRLVRRASRPRRAPRPKTPKAIVRRKRKRSTRRR